MNNSRQSSDPQEPPCFGESAPGHAWRVSHEEAAAIQGELASRVVLRPLAAEGPGSPRFAAGADVAYSLDGAHAWAVAVVMDRRMKVVATSVVAGEPDSDYTSGFLAFREGRLTLAALSALDVHPDLVFFDGHGVVHERALGLASHLGLLLGVPAIGVPKTPFHSIDHDPGPERGDYYVLAKEWGAEGASVRLKRRVKPVYVSPGHLVDLTSALALSLVWSTGKHRVPEPLAAAHTQSVLARTAGMAPKGHTAHAL